jgi:tungstate transport system substrate-binding protein
MVSARCGWIFRCVATVMFSVAIAPAAMAETMNFIVVASTTSTQDSGLLKYLLPLFKEKSGVDVRVIALGTGQALAIARKGDADVLLVHDRDAELKFVEEGYGIARREVMYNDFVIVGPTRDPAKIAGLQDSATALRRIATAESPFASRGDKSGTHAAELGLWKRIGVYPQRGKGSWYRETGSGMGTTLNIASAMAAYTLTDRGTWAAFRNRGDLVVHVEGDRKLINQYGVMLVNPALHPHVKKAAAMQFIDWLTSEEGQWAIARFRVGGQQLFFPNFQRIEK